MYDNADNLPNLTLHSIRNPFYKPNRSNNPNKTDLIKDKLKLNSTKIHVINNPPIEYNYSNNRICWNWPFWIQSAIKDLC